MPVEDEEIMDPLPVQQSFLTPNVTSSAPRGFLSSASLSETRSERPSRAVELSPTRQGAQLNETPGGDRWETQASESVRTTERLRSLLVSVNEEESGKSQTPSSLTGFSASSLSSETQRRIDDQIGRLFGHSHTSPDSLDSSSSEQRGTDRSNLDPDLESYLQLIRSLSKDSDAVEHFLDLMESFMNGGGQQEDSSASLSSFLQQFTSLSAESISQFTLNINISVGASQGQAASSQSAVQVSADGTVTQVDPLVLDLDGDGFELTSVDEGTAFRIDGTQALRQTAFVTGGDAFLALDRSGNGTIDSGLELFGDQHGAADGIEELRKFDENNDNVIDAQDSVFDRLRLFADQNKDGISQSNELSALAEKGIESIFLLNVSTKQTVSGGNQLASSTLYRRTDGSFGQAGDVLLNYRG